MKTRIDIKTIDGLNDLIITDQRPKLMGVHTIELITDQFYKLITEIEYKQQKVQTIAWNKYQIQLLALEDYGAETLKFAKSILITAYEVHQAVIIDIQREKIAGSDFSNITIEYYDTRLQNYKYQLPPVYNFLRSDALSEQYSFSELNVLRVVHSGIVYDFSTLLDLVPTAKQPENATFTNTQSGATIATNQVVKQMVQTVFYLNADDIQPFQSLLPLADGNTIKGYYFTGNVGYNIKEVPSISIEPVSGFNIWKASCDFVYNIKNHYNYGTN